MSKGFEFGESSEVLPPLFSTSAPETTPAKNRIPAPLIQMGASERPRMQNTARAETPKKHVLPPYSTMSRRVYSIAPLSYVTLVDKPPAVLPEQGLLEDENLPIIQQHINFCFRQYQT